MSSQPSSPVNLRDCYVGIDGAKKGWAVASWNPATKFLEFGFVPEQALVLELCVFAAIDIPIGLLDSGKRECDVVAQKRLGLCGKSSSLFPIPPRPLVEIVSKKESCELAEALSISKPSPFAFALFPKIRTIDKMLRESPNLNVKVVETHPELAFAIHGAGRKLFGKKTIRGCFSRLDIIREVWPEFKLTDIEFIEKIEPQLVFDDAVDALMSLVVSIRAHRGDAQGFPEVPQLDSKGLRVQIVV
jgi:predicted RNase H-like nuclease